MSPSATGVDRSGLRRDDVPLQTSLTMQNAGAVEQLLPLSPALSSAVQAMRLCLIANALDATYRGSAKWVFYPRDANVFARRSRNWPAWYTRTATVAAIDSLIAAGYLQHEQTRPSPVAAFRSRFRATLTLLQRLRYVRVEDFRFEPLRDPIILRDRDGMEVSFADSRDRSRMRADVREHNAFLAGFEITVVHPDAALDERGFLVVGDRRFNPGRRQYYRVFNLNFSSGGRWYGPWWQCLPSSVRTGIRIDGEPSIEEDLRALHVRLLAALAAVKLPFDAPAFDAYMVPGIERSLTKVAFNILINADSEQAARQALALELRSTDPARPSAAELLALIRASFPALTPYWHTGIGRRLQNVDAEICARVQRSLRRRGIPCLSVHDSFVVPRCTQAELLATMATEFGRACDHLQRRGLTRRKSASHPSESNQ
jgi:hypothetical protein